MTNSSKNKGDRAELEVQAWFREHLGIPARRALGAGRKDDIGDIHGIPNTVVQVANRKDVAAAVRAKPLECERQQEQAAADFGATFLRLRGGEYRVVLTPAQFAALWREAVSDQRQDLMTNLPDPASVPQWGVPDWTRAVRDARRGAALAADATEDKK